MFYFNLLVWNVNFHLNFWLLLLKRALQEQKGNFGGLTTPLPTLCSGGPVKHSNEVFVDHEFFGKLNESQLKGVKNRRVLLMNMKREKIVFLLNMYYIFH